MRIDPVWQVVAGVTVAVLTAISQGGIPLPPELPAGFKAALVDWDKFLIAVWLVAQPILAGFTSEKLGPFVSAGPPAATPPAANVAKSLLFVMIACAALALLGHSALAQERPAKAVMPSTLVTQINAIGAWAKADVADAIAAANKYPSLQDQIGPACLADVQVLAQLAADHPLPATLSLATDAEYLRLDMAQINRICANTACAQATGDIGRILNLVKKLPVGVSFASLCDLQTPVGLSLTTVAAAPAANPTK